MSENTPTPTAPILSVDRVAKMRARFDPYEPTAEDKALCESGKCGGCFVCYGPPIVGLWTPDATDLIDSHEALRERLRVLEVIRQRVSAGWQALHPATTGGEPFWSEWTNGPIEPMEPGVAAVLWPDEETQ